MLFRAIHGVRTVACLLALLGTGSFRLGAQTFQPLPDFRPDPVHVARLGRTLSLLRSANETNHPVVKIVFYGQSITIYPWWREVSDRLRAAYPQARLEIQNLAISGFMADRLSYTCEQDVVPLQPDLVILHAYGYEAEYGRLLERLRWQTTAEVLAQTDHPLTDEELAEASDPEQLSGGNPLTWGYRNYVAIPRQADRTGCCVAAVRDYWKAYCRARGRKAGQLLADQTHPNEEGNHLMAAAVLAYLIPTNPPAAIDPWNNARVRTLRIQTPPGRSLRRLEVDFTGTRLDVVTDVDGVDPVLVTIDGQKPSAIAAIRRFGRTTTVPGQPWPALTSVDSVASRLEETWTVTILSLSADNSRIEFRVDGSKTGFDGIGNTQAHFVSNSGRVVIPIWSWLLGYALNSSGQPLPKDYRIVWKSDWVGQDQFLPQSPREVGLESARTVVSSLPDGVHRLVLEGVSVDSVRALRAFRPKEPAALVETSRVETNGPPRIGWRYQVGGWLFEKQGADGVRVGVETSTNAVDWLPWAGAVGSAGWRPESREAMRLFRMRPVP